jgi:G:T/U-mismatch repair DNA glycosylase
MDFLPEYMKFCYNAVWDVYEEMEQEMVKEGRAFCVIYAKNEVNIGSNTSKGLLTRVYNKLII